MMNKLFQNLAAKTPEKAKRIRNGALAFLGGSTLVSEPSGLDLLGLPEEYQHWMVIIQSVSALIAFYQQSKAK